MSRLTRAVLGAAVLAVAVPGVANAATLQVDTGKTQVPFRFHYNAAPGEVNTLRVAQGSDGTTFIDDTVPIKIVGDSSLDGCRLEADGDAVCAPNVNPFAFNLGDGNDIITYTGADAISEGIKAGDGNDTIFAGVRRGPNAQKAPGVLTISGGAGTRDKVSYDFAQFGVKVSLDDQPNDGHLVDDQNVRSDVEIVEGSDRADTLVGSTSTTDREIFIGGNGNDSINGLNGTDVFDEGSAPNGSDTYNGASEIDLVDYSKRTTPVNVSLDLSRNDGAAGEQDFVDPNVNDVFGGQAVDEITGSSGANVIRGFGSGDTIRGGAGNDTLDGGTGVDTLLGEDDNDTLEAADNTADVLRCGSGVADVLNADLRDEDATGCETVNTVGRLALAANGGKISMSWTHPKSWKQLRHVTLKLRLREKTVGQIAVRPKSDRIDDTGAVHVKRSKLTHRGGKVTAHMKVRYDRKLAGKVLRADVVAADVHGAKQVERRAALIKVPR
jgi:hemolysin type calcium-binding protein